MDYNARGCIDLHIHSTASDGSLTPPEIIDMASRIGLEAISITDHDTSEGARQALQSFIPAHLKFITGIEMSAAGPKGFQIKGGLHILGYGIDPEDGSLVQMMNKLREIRENRTIRIIEKLNGLGLALTLEQVEAEVGKGTAGRPHVAKAMIRAGLARDINDAFDRYLADERPAYVGKERVSCRQAFDLIHGAGGLPVLAHPYLIERGDMAALKKLVGQLCDMGLKGLEAYYPQHTPEATAQYLELADHYHLLVTGGSDFHGEVTPDIQMGIGSGDLRVPSDLYQALVSYRPTLNSR